MDPRGHRTYVSRGGIATLLTFARGEREREDASQPALVIGGVNPAGRKKRASFPPSAGKLPPSHASGNNSNNAGDAPHGLSDAEKAKIHGKINGAKSLVASEKMRAYLDNRARKQREAMERRYGVAPSSSNGGSNIAPDGSVLSPKLSRPREAHPLTLGVGDEVKRAAAIAVDAGIRLNGGAG